jgi:hypothetical protein
MLELDEKQWSALCAADEQRYISVIRDDIVRLKPELADDPHLLKRLGMAYDHAKHLGFIHDQSIVRFLYIEADVPNFYRQHSIAVWLSKRGMPADERLSMLLDVLRFKMREQQEEIDGWSGNCTA